MKLVEIDLHDGTAAVGKQDGLDIVVADAAKLVGKKAKVLIGRVLEGQAFATLVSGQPGAAPITFESEAEKPTRAPARKKPDEAEVAAAPELGESPETAETELEETAESPEEVTEEAGAETDGQPTAARKRTRRGSRGGKRRKKPAAAAGEAATGADGDAGETEAAAEVVDAEDGAPPATRSPKRRAPRIHVPDARPEELAADGDVELVVVPEPQPDEPGAVGEEPEAADTADEATSGDTPPKKRTRRGTRGGRNRKRKPAAQNGDATAAEADGAPPVESDATPEPASGDGTPDDVQVADEEGYVPMSEWIGDFDRRT